MYGVLQPKVPQGRPFSEAAIINIKARLGSLLMVDLSVCGR